MTFGAPDSLSVALLILQFDDIVSHDFTFLLVVLAPGRDASNDCAGLSSVLIGYTRGFGIGYKNFSSR